MTTTGLSRSGVEDLERFLGDPRNPSQVFSFERCARLDETEEFPREICAVLDEWGLPRHYVPAALGGDLTEFPEMVRLMRAVARRDIGVAVAHGKTFLGGVSAWVAPEGECTRWLAERVIAGDPVSWALTEHDHGSDLLGGDVRAVAGDGGFRLSGEKWLINNATQGRIVSVLARSAEGGGARGFDVFVVDKRQLSTSDFRCLSKIRTHGIRCADISGIEFTDAFVPASARLGEPGSGLETTLKGLQLTRTLCSALSLGAGEHALRLALEFAQQRRPHGRELLGLPRARAVLADAYADLLLAEAVALVGARGIHELTGELSLLSAAVKYLLPTRTDRMIASLGRFLGARSVLLGVFAGGRFQKVARDHRIVAIFDGNTLVNLNSISNEFPTLVRRAGREVDLGPLARVFDLDSPLRTFEPSGLSLVSRRGSSVFEALPSMVERLRGAVGESVIALAERILEHREDLLVELAQYRPVRVKVPRRVFTLAERFSLCLAASAAIGLWSHNFERRAESALWRDGQWLRAVLARILTALGTPVPRSAANDQVLLEEFVRQHQSGLSLSLVPHRIAEGAE